MQRNSITKGLSLLCVMLVTASCSRTIPFVYEQENHPVEVSFSTGCGTRTTVGDDGNSVSWEDSDKLSLWALNSQSQWTLSAQTFRVYGKDKGWARFTSTLSTPMPDDTYTYMACYPVPSSISGTTASFDLSSSQNGKASGGVDVMVSNKVKSGALRSVTEKEVDLDLNMKHLVHLLKFYLPSGSVGLEGEKIKKIKLKMPSKVWGKISFDIAAENVVPVYTGTEQSSVMELAEPLNAPAGIVPQYACAAILPFTAANDDKMEISLISDNWIGTVNPVSLKGREFQAGHCTPIPLVITDVSAFFSVKVKLSACNLGENPTKITLSVPDGKWGDTGSSIYVYNPGGEIPLGTTLSFSFEDYANYLTLSNKTLTVTYESDHVICGQTLQMPALEALHSATVFLTVPYLMNEDFSSVSSFSSNDAYATSSAGDMDAYSFMNGWSGGRVGAQAGKCIRIAGRRECGMWIDAHYPARVDSAPLPQIKASCNLAVSFSYGTNNQYSSSPAKGDVGQTVYIGYVTSTQAYSSSSTDGVYENTFTSTDKSGSYTSTPFSTTVTLTSVPAGNSIRISWRNDPLSKSDFGSNTTSWLYIDNVKVQISK